MNFNYEASKDYAEKIGLIWKPEWLSEFDALAAAHNFTQAQVDIALQCHSYITRYRLFNPKSYTLRQRFLLAFYLIFGKGF